MMSWYPLRIFSIFLTVSFLEWFSLLETSSVYVLQGDSESGGKIKEHHSSHVNHSHHRVSASNDSQNGIAVFNVLWYGADGNGKTDDTKAFSLAWAAACKVEASIMVVPSGFVFLVKPISFFGRGCMPNILFQLDGKIIAPKNFTSSKSGILKWIEFTKLKGITIQGAGTIDGQGSVWWPTSQTNQQPFIYGSSNATVTGITIQNSPQTHLKFDNCQSVEVFNINIASPGDSSNTDGIHLLNSLDVKIHNSTLACARDDCISIQTGCSNVYIHNISCGPSHGISIGSLGASNAKACVSNITVRNTFIENSTYGVRIKTWQGGSGIVKNILFSNITVSGVEIPIMIDQYYCNKNRCTNKTSAVAVAVAGINYEFITASYTVKPVHFACSDSLPCASISLTTINSVAVQGLSHVNSQPFCWSAFGEVRTATVPSIRCLQTNMSWKSRLLTGNYSC